MTELTRESLEELAAQRGVTFDPTRQAESEDDADDKFINLLPLSRSFKVRQKKIEPFVVHTCMFYLSVSQSKMQTSMSSIDVNKIRTSDVTSFLQLARRDNIPVDLEVELASTNDVAPPRSLDDETSTSDGSKRRRRRRKRVVGGDEARYCQARGSSYGHPDSNFLRLCTVCAYSTNLGSNTWPQFVNEADCSADDLNCLVVSSGSTSIRK